MQNKQRNLSNRYALLWLLIGASMMPFIHAQTPLFFAAWLAPLFLLRFSRTVKPLIALPVIGVVAFVANLIAFRGDFAPFFEGPELYVTLVGIALAYVAIFAIDRFTWQRLPGILSTFAYPLASVSVGFLGTLGNPIGTAGAEAYSQTSLTLLQLTSVLGIWSVLFLMNWFATVVNALWERNFDFGAVKVPVVAFAAVLAAVLLFGSVRLTFFAPESDTVRTAGIVLDRELREQRDIPAIIEDLFERSEREAQAGARIVVWSEAAVSIMKEDEQAILERASELAASTDVYLQLGLDVTDERGDERIVENRAIMFTPSGDMAWDYDKAKPTPGDPELPGTDDMPYIDTPYGRIATIICQDDLFPGLVAQAGRLDVDILLVPSNDWQGIADWHNHMAKARAIENGVNIVRPTSRGISSVIDSTGRTVAEKGDYFTTDSHTFVAFTPTAGTKTIYPHIGEVFAYAVVTGLGAVIGVAVYRKIRKQ